MTNLAAALFANAHRQGFIDVPALVHDAGEVSYAGLDRLSNQAANLLYASGLQAGDNTLFLQRDTPELVALFLGAIKAGIVPTVLSTRISPEDLGHALSDSAANVLFVDPEFAALALGAIGQGTLVLETTAVAGELENSPDTFEPVHREDHDAAFWVCSSGSTSRPKSVVHTHGGVTAANGFHREHLRLAVGTRILCTATLSFAYPLSNALLAALDVGASIVLYPDWHDPESLLRTLANHQPEVVFSTPTLYRRVLHAVDDEARTLDRVATWVSAGEHLSAGLNDAWRELTGRPILDCYGTSETLFLITASDVSDVRADSSGCAVSGVEVELRDPEGNAVPANQIGELYVRHPFLASGYAGNPEQTRQRFRDGWFATGDLFLYDTDGYWYYRGREDSRIKIAGQWVHLQDIEDAVSERDTVSEVAAVSVPDEDGLDRVALFVVPESNCKKAQVTADVQERLQRLPSHKRPRWLELADSLPRTNTGKIKRHELRGMILARGH